MSRLIYSQFTEVNIHEKSAIEIEKEIACPCNGCKQKVKPSKKRDRKVTISASIMIDDNEQPVLIYGAAVKSLKNEKSTKPNAEARSKAVARQILLSKVNSKFRTDFVSLQNNSVVNQLFTEEKVNQILSEIVLKIEEVNSVRRFLKEYTTVIDWEMFEMFDPKEETV